ncbi:MAG TPA: DUF1559 domain-containing protein [Pirellulales bacterium]|nr:DUF1559 domain-containing protein [Pirellulales bacterium]
MELFAITCMTCKARLKVRDTAAIGAILACPKCGGMVLVTAPDGWKPPEPRPPDGAGQPQMPAESGPIKAAPDRSAVRGGSSIDLPAMTTTKAAGTAAHGDKKSPRWQDDVTVAAGVAAGAVERGGGPQSNLGEAGSVPDAAAGASTKAVWIKWGTFVGAPLAGLGLIVGGWLLFSRSRGEPELLLAPTADVPQRELREVQEPSPPLDDAPVPPAPLDRRWLPSAAEGVLSFRPRDLEQQSAARTVLGHTATLWNPTLATFFASFPLTPADIRRLTWAATDLAAAEGDDWLAAGVVIVELERPVAERKDWLDGCAVFDGKLGFDGKLSESILRTVSQGDWPNPFAVVDDRTIVTGPAAALEAISDRGGPRAAQTELDRLVDRLDAAPELLWALDLAAVRARDAMPAWLPLVEMWHADHDDWHVVRELPLAVGLGLRIGERFEMELLLACDGESSAEQVEQALGRVLTAVEQTLAGEAEGLTKKLLAGEITTADAGQLKLLFSASHDALGRREFRREGPVIRLTADWRGDWSAVAQAAVASVPELESSRLAAARVLDEEHHLKLLEALDGFAKAEHGFPAGAGGATLFAPEDRLSWIATLLPYYGHLDWHGELSFGRPWNEALNARVTRRPLDLVVNPALGPGQTKAGFPVTHYVGLAGLGADAGKLEAGDRRAGLFGYNRRTSREQIGDGASHTIAIMGVSGKLGAWAAGGEATVRPLTTQPYVNGPDGFGSGQPNGMLVGMADGSVRFISNQIDPGVLERMATVNGGESGLELPLEPERVAGKDAEARTADIDSGDDGDDGVEEPKAKPVKPRPTVRRHVKPDAEVTARLADPIPAIEFDKVPLADVLRILSDFSTLEISLDVEALAETGVKPDVKVTLRLKSTSVGGVLDAALAEHQLVHVVADGQVLVTSPRRLERASRRRSFDVHDLTSDERAAAEELAALVRELVQPASWQESGGRGRVQAASSKLEVEQTAAVEHQVSLFLDKLRLARGRPIAPGPQEEESTLDTRYALARPRLEQPVTANFNQPTPLAKIASHLEKAAKIKLVFDGLALTQGGQSPQSEATLSVDRRPLAEALAGLLEPLGLRYRIVNAHTIQITTRKAAGEWLELEFHRIGDLFDGGLSDSELTPDALCERVLEELSPRTWSEAGGSGVLHYDDDSKCLIVLQSQDVQIALERLLGRLRTEK